MVDQQPEADGELADGHVKAYLAHRAQIRELVWFLVHANEFGDCPEMQTPPAEKQLEAPEASGGLLSADTRDHKGELLCVLT